jgi:gamma-glutamyl-gamma-aminobutyrate hydrolase PuuD
MMGNKILVLNGSSYGDAVAELGELVTDKELFYSRPREFKLVLFTGGADISPELYGDTSPHGVCSTNPERDVEEIKVYDKALKLNIPMAGICRGLQLLNAMAGGSMIHHLDGHGYTTHGMTLATGECVKVNSLHHQAIIPPESAVVVGWSTGQLSKDYFGTADEVFNYTGKEIEAAIFPRTNAFGVQYHPEMAPESFDMYAFFHTMVRYALTLSKKEFIKTYRKKDYANLFASIKSNSTACRQKSSGV